jgi:DNA-binding PadR family transcriptional regulator
MQPVTNLALQVTEIHPVIGFQVTDEGAAALRRWMNLRDRNAGFGAKLGPDSEPRLWV